MNLPKQFAKYNLGFITDDDFEGEVRAVYDAGQRKKTNFDIHANIVDPFSATFSSSFEGLSRGQWIERESIRQFDKAVSNSIGTFHQKMMGYLPGWVNQGSNGYWDLRSTKPYGPTDLLVFAELKNKHNTMNSENAKKLYQKFESALDMPDYRGSVGYLIEVIPKKSTRVDEPWAPAKKLKREDIRRVNAEDIYLDATGDPEIILKILTAIPKAVQNIVGKSNIETKEFQFTDLYDLAFKKGER